MRRRPIQKVYCGCVKTFAFVTTDLQFKLVYDFFAYFADTAEKEVISNELEDVEYEIADYLEPEVTQVKETADSAKIPEYDYITQLVVADVGGEKRRGGADNWISEQHEIIGEADGYGEKGGGADVARRYENIMELSAAIDGDEEEGVYEDMSHAQVKRGGQGMRAGV